MRREMFVAEKVAEPRSTSPLPPIPCLPAGLYNLRFLERDFGRGLCQGLLETRAEELRTKIDTIRQLKENQKGPVRILDEVSRAMPDLLWLTSLNLAGNHLTLNGMVLDENAFANYVDSLNASPFFGEPTVVTLQRSRENAFSFRLECDFNYSPAEIASTNTEEEG